MEWEFTGVRTDPNISPQVSVKTPYHKEWYPLKSPKMTEDRGVAYVRVGEIISLRAKALAN